MQAKSKRKGELFLSDPGHALEAGKGKTELLDEECFAKLIAADKRFHRSVTGKEILDLAVLVHALHGTQNGSRNHL